MFAGTLPIEYGWIQMERSFITWSFSWIEASISRIEVKKVNCKSNDELMWWYESFVHTFQSKYTLNVLSWE
jgi:hypothetical protein